MIAHVFPVLCGDDVHKTIVESFPDTFTENVHELDPDGRVDTTKTGQKCRFQTSC